MTRARRKKTVCGADLPEGGKCQRTDIAPHPRGGAGYHCWWHTDSYFNCECCGATYVSTPATTARMPVTDVQRREGGPDFVGFPLCEDCKDHHGGDAYVCAHAGEEDEGR